MTVATDDFSAWLAQARVAEHRLSPDQRGVLFAAFHFRQSRGHDSYSTRLLSHFLLHAQTGLQVAQIARLVGVSRPTASGQQGMSSKEAVQQAHHRMDGRPYGKLLPRFAGPIIEFLLARPQATRADLIDFIDQTFGVRVSRIALYKFLKKFGLDRVGVSAPGTAPATPPVAPASPDPPTTRPVATPAATSAPPFCSDAHASRAHS
jgi:transposase